jgi:replicative DNA helicase
MDLDTVDPSPHALLSEKTLLSLMFRNPRNIARAAADGVAEDSFHIPAHRCLLQRLEIAFREGKTTQEGEIDLTLLVQDAAKDGLLERMGGAAELYSLATYAWDDHGWLHHISAIRGAHALRIAQDASQSILGSIDAEEALQRTTEALSAIKRASQPKTRSKNAKQCCDEFVKMFVSIAQSGDIPGSTSGIDEIDGITGGLRPGDLWVVSGPSSSGKSALMYQIASQFLGDARRVPIFSAELSAGEVIGRLAALHARVPYSSITNPRSARKDELKRIQTTISQLSETLLHVDSSAGLSIATITAECERLHDLYGQIDLIVVDYIQIVGGCRKKGDTREQEVASISGGLKQLAKLMGCPVITGSQLNKNGTTRESQAVEQDADVLMVIEQDAVTMKKVRNGRRGDSVPIRLDGESQRFRHYAMR